MELSKNQKTAVAVGLSALMLGSVYWLWTRG